MQVSIDYTKFPEADVVVNYMFDRFRKGLYTLVLTTGLPGSGKSSTCMRLGELFYKKLGTTKLVEPTDIVDSLLSLLSRLNKVKAPGEVIIIEELSVLFPARRAMARANVAIARVLDTCRKKGVILISNAPLFNSIDSHIRALANILVETLKIVKTQGVVVSKAFRLQTNPRSSKTYLHRFKRNGREVHRIYTRKPNSRLWDLYESAKDQFIHDLYHELEAEEVKQRDKRIKSQPVNISGIPVELTPKEKELFSDLYVKNMKQSDIAKKNQVSEASISLLKAKLKKKLENHKGNEGFKPNLPIPLAIN